jgi:hypothetical protein
VIRPLRGRSGMGRTFRAVLSSAMVLSFGVF